MPAEKNGAIDLEKVQATRPARKKVAVQAPAERVMIDAPEEPAPPPSRSEEIACYRRAIERLRAGDANAAARELREYLTRYPNGTLRDEAELSLLEALAAASDEPALAEAAARWLTDHPGHPRAAEVKNLFEGRAAQRE
jgi:TolA-binding protein